MSSLDPATFVRPELRQLKAYTLDQVDCRFKLDQNEVPWDLPKVLKREALARVEARNWALYPDFHADRLRAMLAEAHDWSTDGVLVGNGSNELLGITLEALVGPGVRVLGAEPSFGLYPMLVVRAGGTPEFLPPRADLKIPLEELKAKIAEDPRRPVLLCSPNNPTGDALEPEEIESLLGELEAPFLLDNAYGEFCRHDYRPLLRRHPNLVIFRTFSKAWSLGGMRLGYLLGDPRLVHELIKVKLPYNMSHAAAAIGEVVLENPQVSARAVRVLLGRRAQWIDALRALGLEVLDSEGNFFLVRTPHAEALRRGLGDRGILVREVGHYPGLEGCVRFAVGDGRALRATCAATQEILEEVTT